MNTYIALLRGINISGKNKIAMSELKSECEKLGLNKVSTYLNSGNIVFQSECENTEKLAEDIMSMISSCFSLDIPVCIISCSALNDILEKAPEWWDSGNKKIYDNIILPIRPTSCDDVHQALGEPSEGIDMVSDHQQAIYWSFDLDHYRKSQWWIRSASTDIKDHITIRTANTMKKVLQICQKTVA